MWPCSACASTAGESSSGSSVLIETRAAQPPPTRSLCVSSPLWIGLPLRRRCERGVARGDRQGTRIQTAANAAAVAVRGAVVADARTGTPKQALTGPAACRRLFILVTRLANRGHRELRLGAAPTPATEFHPARSTHRLRFRPTNARAIRDERAVRNRDRAMTLFSPFFFQAQVFHWNLNFNCICM